MADMVKMPDGTSQGFHVNADSFAEMFSTGDAKAVNLTRMERAAKMFKGAPQAEVKDSLRGASADEKKQGNKLPPFVRSAIARGMSEAAARNRLSELRNLWNAYLNGLKFDDELVGQGFEKAHDTAKQFLAGKASARKTEAQNAFYSECYAKVRADAGVPIGMPMSPEQAAAVEEAAANLYKRRTEEQATEGRQNRLNKAAEEALNDDDPNFAHDLATLILERLEIREEAAKRRAEDQAAMPKNQAPQGAQTAEGAATVPSMAEPAQADTQAARAA